MFQKQMLGWDVFIRDKKVRACIFLYYSKAEDEECYNRIMEDLWEKVMRNPMMFSRWKNRVDHINENRSVV